MRDFIHGLREDAAARPRTLVAARGHVWLWPGIVLSEQRGDEIVPASPENIRFWVTRLHGPEALHTEVVHFVKEAARQLTFGNDNAAQRALDSIGLSQLSRDGAALMYAVAKRLGIEALDMPLHPGPRCWSMRDIDLQAPFFAKSFDPAAPLAKFGIFDPLKHPRWPAGAPDSQGGRFAPANESDAAIEPIALHGHKGRIKRWRRRHKRHRSKTDREYDRDYYEAANGREEKPKRGIGDNSEKFNIPPIPRTKPERDPYATVKEIAAAMEQARALDATGLIGPTLVAASVTAWMMSYPTYYYDQLRANLDPPKTLQELQDGVDKPTRGYHIHHIVERNKGESEFSEAMLESRENLVLVPAMKHRLITTWYQTPNDEYGGLSPRVYLRGKTWEEQREVGIGALIRFGVLKP